MMGEDYKRAFPRVGADVCTFIPPFEGVRSGAAPLIRPPIHPSLLWQLSHEERPPP